ncbi:hypothetical protein FJ365_05165, partial [Candidatus Dependentiae bacterium]|nr:hypothetical protein [Candidatus Dependentiae bacterium]
FRTICKRFTDYLLVFLQTQCALTIVSLPIIVYWGLGISTVAVVGNLLFTPLLMLFLFVCTLTFFAALFQLPHGYLTLLLNMLSEGWQHALSFSSQQWIIYCAKPSLIVLALPVVALILCLRHPAINNASRRLLAMVSILAIFLGYCWLQQQYMLFSYPTKLLHEKLYAIVRADNQLMIIDEGFAARKKSPDKVVDFQVLPELAKTYGSMAIAEYTISKPTRGSMKAAEQVCKKCAVKEVRLPYFSAPTNKSTWRAFYDLKRTLEAQQIPLIRYNEKHLAWWRYKLRSWVAKDAPLKMQS